MPEQVFAYLIAWEKCNDFNYYLRELAHKLLRDENTVYLKQLDHFDQEMSLGKHLQCAAQKIALKSGSTPH